MADPNDMNKRVGAAIRPVAEEMEARLEGDFSDRDTLAIRTAILKACVAGMHLGTVETTAQVIEQAPGATINLTTSPLADQLARLDLWADEYGAEGS